MNQIAWVHMAVVGWALALVLGYVNATSPTPPHPRQQAIQHVPECQP